jgi:putative transposase
MELNELGKIAQQELLKTTDIRWNIEINSFVVMPNHVHFIVHIVCDAARRGELHSPKNENVENDNIQLNFPENENCEMQMAECNALNETGECNANIQTGECNQGECNSPLPPPLRIMPNGTSQTVGAMVRGYKSAVTKQLYVLGFSGKLWQRNYYEHIIRTPESYERIANYIENNPACWDNDKFHIIS